MPKENRWNLVPPSPAAAEMADRLKTSPLIAQILLNRGVAEPEDAGRFLFPTLHHLEQPSAIGNLARAADRIARAIRDGEKIVIYGDYDVDGITATAILWHAIRQLGGKAHYYIPHRLEEGYGLNAEAIGQICDDGAQLIITVDCGVTAIEEAAVAAARGVEMIITDHHEWRHDEQERPILPECHSVVHPRLPGEGGAIYPNPYLCGAGVAFKLAWGVGQAHSGADRVSEDFRWFLVEATALAALGTIADVVPLKGENRTLAHFGLGGLKNSRLTGIKALIDSANLSGKKLDSYHVGFLLAPRLNACGRMGHARLAVEMLTDADAAKAAEIATYLEQQNRARQAMERKILEEAMAQVVELGYDRDDCRGVVLGAEGWHPGVIGIVASRIVNRLNRPTVMVALNNGHGQGSARSIPGFHLARALENCREHLDGCGGHEMAAGLRLQTPMFEQFREAFCRCAAEMLTEQMLIPELKLDCAAELRQITPALVKDMERLGPFGMGNRKPILCCTDVELVSSPRRVGKSADHLQLLVRQGRQTIKCIGFGLAERFADLSPGTRLDLAVEPQINEYNGFSNVELEVKDVRPAQVP